MSLIVVTGRRRTLTWSGSLSGTHRYRLNLPLAVVDIEAYASLSAQASGCAVSSVSRSGLIVSASNGIASQTQTLPAPSDDYTIEMGGTWVVSLDVEECFEVSVLDPSLVDADGYPTFGGPSLKDGPVARRIRFFERLRAGGTAVATITSGPLTATASSVVGPGPGREVSYDLSVAADGAVTNMSMGYSIAGGPLAGGWAAPAYSHTRSGSLPAAWSATATVGVVDDSLSVSLSLSATDPPHPGDINGVSAAASGSCVRASGYRVEGRALRWTDTYDGVLTAHVKTTDATGVSLDSSASGVWAAYDVVHRSWSASATVAGDVIPPISGGVPATSCRVHLVGSSLAAAGEDSRDWRLLIAGKPFRVLTVDHAATATVPGNGEGYRYLRVQHRSVGAANQPWTLTIGSKSWNLQTGADGVTVTSDVDLCNPDNASAATDGKSSRYPLDGPGGDPVDSVYWGVSVVPTPTYSKPPEVEVIGVNLQRQSGFARLSWAPALTPWLEAWTSPTDTTRHKPHGWSEVDGRVADIPSAFFVDVSGPGDYYSHQTIDQTRSRLDGFGGWSASLFGSSPDAFHNGDRDSWWIGGTGHVWRGYPSGAWQSEIDREVSGSTDVWGCGLWDEVEGYPGIGDAWERTDYPTGSEPTRLPVRFSKILRGQAWGIVLGPDGVLPASGDAVTLRRASDDADRGNDTTDARGSYQTRSPYGQGEVSHYVETPDVDTAAFLVNNRMRHRWVVAGNPTGGQMSLDISNERRLYRAYLKGGTIRIGHTDRTLSWNDRDTGTGGDWVGIAVDRNAVIHLVYEGGGSVLYTQSYDDGTTWAMPTTIATGKKPAICIGADNRRYLYWIDGTTVKGRIEDAGGVVVESIFTAVSGVQDEGVAATIARGVGLTQTIVLLCVVSGSLTQYTSTDGKTFS